MRSHLAIFLSLLVAACDSAPAPAPASDDAADASAPIPDPDVYRDRIAVFLLADSVTLDRIRAENGTDSETIFDDMMWYRAEAWSWLEERGIPIASIEGRDSLRFRVDGADRAYGFDDAPTADVVVLYEPGRPPLPVAPIDVPAEAAGYFRGPPPPAD